MNTQSNTLLESVVARFDIATINFVLTCFGPDVHVVGHRMLETGYELVLEGPEVQVLELIRLFESVRT